MSLDINWRNNTGTFVCGKSGDDVGGTGTKTLPYKTIGRGLSDNPDTLNIRNDYYNEGNFTIPNPSSSSIFVFNGDGRVVIDSSTLVGTIQATNRRINLNNLVIINGALPVISGSACYLRVFKDCFVKDTSLEFGITTPTGGGTTSSTGNIFKNCTIGRFSGSYTRSEIQTSTFLNCTKTLDDGDGFVFVNCAFFEDNDITASRLIFDKCAFSPTELFNGTQLQNISLTGDGGSIGNTYIDGQSFSGSVGNITFTDCFYTASPKFYSPTDDDYTLQPDSPLNTVFVNTFGFYVRQNRGKHAHYVQFDATNPALLPANGAFIDSTIIVSEGKFILKINADSGRIISSPNFPNLITLPFYQYLWKPIEFHGIFDYSTGSWVDEANYNASTNPEVRLTYKIRVYDVTTGTWSDWYDMEAFEPAQITNNGIGNGDVSVDFTDITPIGGRYFQVDILIRRNGV